ncbi:hypothetical protein [Streptomyces sp. NRRL S-378]|uniref:hypothetical protein n=1 Tax=Streptomyces sp. NRRL S-378 TaxID=1463904 RepID=UPI0004C7F16D|nr:hypothetical protein [Streptomyces sp. NRRL S-378]
MTSVSWALSENSVTTLPGVRLWMRRLLGDLRSGRSCLCLFPQAQLTGAPVTVEALLDELLHELADFVLVPAPSDDPAHGGFVPAATPPVPPRPWDGLDPILDYDDGLSAFSSMRKSRAEIPQARSAPAPAARREETGFHPLADRIVKEVGDWASDDRGRTGIERLLDRLTSPACSFDAGRVIVVRSWKEPVPTAGTDLLRRLSATVKSAGLPPGQRPRLLVLATPGDLPAELPDQIAREDVGVHWWWGALGRLDTATVVAMARPQPSGPAAQHQLLEAVAQATVVEVCGPFLDLAARLAVEWDGLPDNLFVQLQRLTAGASADRPPLPIPQKREPPAALLHPNASQRPEWNRGTLERWDGRLRRRPNGGAGQQHSVRTRIWLAQNHALLPLLDEAREQFTEVIGTRSRISATQLTDLYGRRAGMELGAMWHAYVQGHVRLTRREADRLRTLWASRNKLAHRTALDNTALSTLIHALCS